MIPSGGHGDGTAVSSASREVRYMTLGFDPTDIVACALRPAGSWAHLSSLIGFVVVTWVVSPSRRGRLSRQRH
jgi:hypothetical protein